MSLRSCHKLQKNALFAFKKGNIAYVSHLKNLIVGFYTHIANNAPNLLILL